MLKNILGKKVLRICENDYTAALTRDVSWVVEWVVPNVNPSIPSRLSSPQGLRACSFVFSFRAEHVVCGCKLSLRVCLWVYAEKRERGRPVNKDVLVSKLVSLKEGWWLDEEREGMVRNLH